MNILTSRLFRLARSHYASHFIGYAFEYTSSMIPVRRLFEDRIVMAFLHPVPFWKIHYLIVPKRRVPSFASIDLADRHEMDRVLQILQTAQALGRQSRLTAYAVLVNGGEYQDVPQLHFHVAGGGRKDGEAMYEEQNLPKGWIKGIEGAIQQGNVMAIVHPTPAREFHYVFISANATPDLWSLNFFNPDHRNALAELLRLAQQIVEEHRLDRYTLLANINGDGEETCLQLHLVSGCSV